MITVVSHNAAGFINKAEEVMQELCMGDGAAPDIIFLQETNVHAGVLYRLEGLETGWAAAFNDKLVGRMKGTGIIIREGDLLGSKTTIEPVYDDSNELFDILAVKFRSLLLVNVYVHVIRERTAHDVLDELLSTLVHKVMPAGSSDQAGDEPEATGSSDHPAPRAGQ